MSRIAVAVAALVLAACGSLPTGTVVRTSAPSTTAGPTQAGVGVDMCTLMPLADVQAKSPFQTALSQFKAGADPGMCQYTSADEESDHVSVLLEVTEFSSADNAQASFSNARQAAVDAGLTVADINGLGDSAYASGVDEVGVHALAGNRIIDANTKGEWPDTTDDAKISAGTELVRTILSRLP